MNGSRMHLPVLIEPKRKLEEFVFNTNFNPNFDAVGYEGEFVWNYMKHMESILKLKNVYVVQQPVFQKLSYESNEDGQLILFNDQDSVSSHPIEFVKQYLASHHIYIYNITLPYRTPDQIMVRCHIDRLL